MSALIKYRFKSVVEQRDGQVAGFERDPRI
jgi:hypothetical protein